MDDKQIKRVVEWAASLTDVDIEDKNPASLSYLYALRHAAQKALEEWERP